jgi:hypothetical protein
VAKVSAARIKRKKKVNVAKGSAAKIRNNPETSSHV